MSKPRPAPAATRALAILDFLASRPTEAFTLTELAQELGINPASTHAVLAAMTATGYLVRHPAHKTYRLGPSTMAVGHAALESHPVIGVARQEMERIAAELDLECAAAAPLGDELVQVARVGRPHPYRPMIRVGQRLLLVPPLGMMYMAWSSPEEIEAWLRRSEQWPTDEAVHRSYLDSARALGYVIGLSTEGGYVPLIASNGRLDLDPRRSYPAWYIAAPVFDQQGRVASVINVDGFRSGVRGAQLARYALRLLEGCMVVTHSSHGVVPPNLDRDLTSS